VHRQDTWGVGNHAAQIWLVTVHVLDNLKSNVEGGGFCEEFHEGIVSLMSAEYPESIIVSTVRISGGGAGMDSAWEQKKTRSQKNA